MPDLTDALNRLKAHDPARNLAPLSVPDRENNRAQIIATVRAPVAGGDSRRHGPHDHNTGRPRRLRIAPLFSVRRGTVLAVSAGAAAVVVLIGVGGITGGRHSHSGLSFAVSPAATAELHKVAHAASRQVMPIPGEWEYTDIKLENLGMISASNETVTYSDTETEQTWYAPNGDARQRMTTDNFAFATPQDQATYLANKAAMDATGSLPTQYMTPGLAEDVYYPGQPVQSPVWVTSPPTNPRTLISEIWNQYRTSGAGNHQALEASKAEDLWDSLTTMLLNSTSAQLRATAYSALAYVPYTTVLGKATDQLGRSGIEINFTHDSTGTIQTLIVDPTTGDLLELDRTQKKTANGIPAGTVTQREIFMQRAIVAADTDLPGGGYQPFTPTSQPGPAGTTTGS